MAKTNAEHQRASKQSKKDQGLVRVEEWVPKGLKSLLKQYAERLRESRDD